MSSSSISKRSSGGFTLVEILVSFTVLGLIMVGVAQMMNSALSATLGGYKHMDADTQARMVLDRMAFDISKITKRADVDYFFQKNAGND
ncbi:MAG TPA: prepilin-type N-terminal cleavage/methylation domain-containing protein, partial [Candidatus Methylacidiphilales bacterium]